MAGRLFLFAACGFLLGSGAWTRAYADTTASSGLIREWFTVQKNIDREGLLRLYPWLPKNIRLPSINVGHHPALMDALHHLAKGKGRAVVRAWIKESQPYEEILQAIFSEREIAKDLKCVALVESGFRRKARSAVGAVGLWQLMPETAEQHGLVRSHWIDERMDFSQSTLAATEILSSLRRRFGTWELAWAAYNLGSAALTRIVRRYNNNDFWRLTEFEGAIPRETREYVTRIGACTWVMNNLDAFSFESSAKEQTSLRAFAVPPGVALEDVAQGCNISLSQLKSHNPQFLRDHTPPARTSWLFYLPPQARCDAFSQSRANGEVSHKHSLHVQDQRELGATLRRFGMTVDDVLSFNGYRRVEDVAQGSWLLLPLASQTVPEKPLIVMTTLSAPIIGHQRSFYVVENADSIDSLAKRFSIEPAALIRWNYLGVQARLQEGMILQLFFDTTRDLSAYRLLYEPEVRVVLAGSRAFYEHVETTKGRKPRAYTVRSGDTLTQLSKKFGQSMASIKAINYLEHERGLEPGKTITVYLPPSDESLVDPQE